MQRWADCISLTSVKSLLLAPASAPSFRIVGFVQWLIAVIYVALLLWSNAYDYEDAYGYLEETDMLVVCALLLSAIYCDRLASKPFKVKVVEE